MPLAKSSTSTSTTDNPRAATSTAIPSPIAPPPMTTRSHIGASARLRVNSARAGCRAATYPADCTALIARSQTPLVVIGDDVDHHAVLLADPDEARRRRAVNDEIVEVGD